MPVLEAKLAFFKRTGGGVVVGHLNQEQMRSTPLRPTTQEQRRLKLDLVKDAWRRERRNEQEGQSGAAAGIGVQ